MVNVTFIYCTSNLTVILVVQWLPCDLCCRIWCSSWPDEWTTNKRYIQWFFTVDACCLSHTNSVRSLNNTTDQMCLLIIFYVAGYGAQAGGQGTKGNGI